MEGGGAAYSLKFAVADTGIGIDREGAKKLRTFSVFNQVQYSLYTVLYSLSVFNQITTPESTKLNVRGTGLGTVH
jgi:hypothetical protein